MVGRRLLGWFKEGKVLAVELRRREWGRLGGPLKKQPWVKRYRTLNFLPTFCQKVVGRWLERPGGRRMY